MLLKEREVKLFDILKYLVKQTEYKIPLKDTYCNKRNIEVEPLWGNQSDGKRY